MNTKERCDLLKTLCEETASVKTSEPYKVEINGEPYECATDGRSFLAIKAERSKLKPFPFKDEKDKTTFFAYFQPANTQLPGDALAAFFKLNECANCPLCSGTGKRLAIKPLRLDDFGDVFGLDPFESVRYVKVGDVLIDGNRLALALVGLAMPEMVSVYVPKLNKDEKKQRAFIFYGGNWLLAIMPVRDDNGVIAGVLPLPEKPA